MVEKHRRVVLLKLLEEPPPLFDRQVITTRNKLNQLFQALEGVLLSLLLKLPRRHLLTEREYCTAAETDGHTERVLVYTVNPDSTAYGVRSLCVNLRAALSRSRPRCRVCRALVTASVRDGGV